MLQPALCSLGPCQGHGQHRSPRGPLGFPAVARDRERQSQAWGLNILQPSGSGPRVDPREVRDCGVGGISLPQWAWVCLEFTPCSPGAVWVHVPPQGMLLQGLCATKATPFSSLCVQFFISVVHLTTPVLGSDESQGAQCRCWGTAPGMVLQASLLDPSCMPSCWLGLISSFFKKTVFASSCPDSAPRM